MNNLGNAENISNLLSQFQATFLERCTGDIARSIGHILVPSQEQGVLELVKFAVYVVQQTCFQISKPIRPSAGLKPINTTTSCDPSLMLNYQLPRRLQTPCCWGHNDRRFRFRSNPRQHYAYSARCTPW